MPKPKRNILAVVEATISPPDSLESHEQIARVKQGAGNHLYHLTLANGREVLAELPSRFRSTIWLRRGSYVLLDQSALSDRDNKLGGMITNLVGDYKAWRKMPYWPAEFQQKSLIGDGDSSDDDGYPRMPEDSEDE